MYKVVPALLLIIVLSCKPSGNSAEDKIITVSIAPFKYFVDQISGDDYKVNVMVPYGSDPHVYEPSPLQINQLMKSKAYISNGYLSFEDAWLGRFYEANPSMKRLSLAGKIEPLGNPEGHKEGHSEAADPHYWVSPKCALIMALSVRDLLNELNPEGSKKYDANYQLLSLKIKAIDSLAAKLFSDVSKRSFMIYHPNLGYVARDYGLEEISVEYEGKEPSAARLKDLIDRARADNLRTIFIQKEFDIKNAKAIARELDARVVIIDPLSEDWLKSVTDIIYALHNSLI